MGVDLASSYLVAAWFCKISFAIAGKQRANHKYRTAQSRTFLDEFLSLDIGCVDVIGFEGETAFTVMSHLDSHTAQQSYEILHVENLGYIFDRDLLIGEQYSADYLERLVLRSLRINVTMQLMAAFDNKCTHDSM